MAFTSYSKLGVNCCEWVSEAPGYCMNLLRHGSGQRQGVRIKTIAISRYRRLERKFNIVRYM